jgi:hypothetical protein
MNIILIGLDHTTQARDPTGDLERILADLVSKRSPDLIAEEANTSGATVARSFGGLNMDMSAAERIAAGIDGELRNRPWQFIVQGDAVVGEIRDYLPKADAIREAHWVAFVLKQRASSAILLCGLLHMQPLAAKLREKGCQVEEVNLCDCDWYRAHVGNVEIFEKDSRRWAEFRYPSGQERKIYG